MSWETHLTHCIQNLGAKNNVRVRRVEAVPPAPPFGLCSQTLSAPHGLPSLRPLKEEWSITLSTYRIPESFGVLSEHLLFRYRFLNAFLNPRLFNTTIQ
jgi:hypothetical protein